MSSGSESIRVVNRAFDIIGLFSFDQPELSFAEIQEHTGLPKATVFRIISTLSQRSLLEQDINSGRYHLGYEFIKLGTVAQSSNKLSEIALPIMKEVSDLSKQTCNLYVKEGDERICIAQITGSDYIHKISFLGARHPLYCGAGKLLLAYSSDSFIEDYLSRTELKRFTEKTITDKEQLKEQLAEIRKTEISVTLGERDQSTAMIAAPVFDYDRIVKAALTISGPLYFFTDDNIKTYITILRQYSRILSKKLGY